MTYATVVDVSTRLGRSITDSNEIAQVQAWLEDVEAEILARIPDLPALITAGAPTVATVVRVEANAVIRKIRNPEGYTSETIDDYTYRYNEQVRRGDIFITDEEWALLLPGARSGAWTITPSGARRRDGEWVHPDVWVPAP